MKEQFEKIHELFEKMPSQKQWEAFSSEKRASLMSDELIPQTLEIIDGYLPVVKKFLEVNGIDFDYNAHDEGGEVREGGKVRNYLIPRYFKDEIGSHFNQRWMDVFSLANYILKKNNDLKELDFIMITFGVIDNLRRSVWDEMSGMSVETCWKDIQKARSSFEDARNQLPYFKLYASIVLDEHERKRVPLSAYETSKVPDEELKEAHATVQGFGKEAADTIFPLKPKIIPQRTPSDLRIQLTELLRR
jgi:hypothetical protein